VPTSPAPSLPDPVATAAHRASLYRTRADAHTGRGWQAHDHDDLLASDDPFGGRIDPTARPVAVLQACADAPLYWGLDRPDLDAMGEVLEGCWRALGVQAGDRVAIHDYGSSPVVLYASRAFVPHLTAGAADRISCVPICNDGLAELVDRAAHLITYVRPRVVIVAAHAVAPLRQALVERPPPEPVTLVVTADEDPWTAEALAELVGVGIRRATQLLRIDLALLLAPPCRDDPTRFHPDPDAYTIEVLDEGDVPADVGSGRSDRLVVTHRKIVTCPVVRYASEVRGRVWTETCTCGSTDPTVAVAP
jgi:phenylacetate-coenzyme A ligase PaaK-like adenylate-forming protein